MSDAKPRREVASSPSLAEDPLTRLWERADGSHGHSGEAVAEVRDRKRREQEAARSARRWSRAGRPSAVEAERVECERCKQTVERASSERVVFPSPADEPVEHLLCSRCADEVRRGLLRLLAGEPPLPAPNQEEQEVPVTIPARAGWFFYRMTAYGLIALAVFALVTWLSVR